MWGIIWSLTFNLRSKHVWPIVKSLLLGAVTNLLPAFFLGTAIAQAFFVLFFCLGFHILILEILSVGWFRFVVQIVFITARNWWMFLNILRFKLLNIEITHKLIFMISKTKRNVLWCFYVRFRLFFSSSHLITLTITRFITNFSIEHTEILNHSLSNHIPVWILLTHHLSIARDGLHKKSVSLGYSDR